MKSNNYRPLFFVGSLLLLGLFIGAPSVRALSISPVTFELFADPGGTVSSQIKVTNDTDSPVGVSMGVESFLPVGEEGQVILDDSPENITFSLTPWVILDKTSFFLQPKEVQLINFTANVPANAEPGGHYASILAKTSADAEGGGVGVAQKIGSLLLMQVAGDVKEQLSLKTFSAPNFSEYGPVAIEARFENTGSVHLKPLGTITLKNIFGRKVGEIDMPQKNVLPNSIRKIDVPVGMEHMFGRYEANMLAIYGSTNEPISAQVSFWVIPWRITLAVLVILLVVAIFTYRARRRLGKALKILFKGE